MEGVWSPTLGIYKTFFRFISPLTRLLLRTPVAYGARLKLAL